MYQVKINYFIYLSVLSIFMRFFWYQIFDLIGGGEGGESTRTKKHYWEESLLQYGQLLWTKIRRRRKIGVICGLFGSPGLYLIHFILIGAKETFFVRTMANYWYKKRTNFRQYFDDIIKSPVRVSQKNLLFWELR